MDLNREKMAAFPRPDFRRVNWLDLTGEWDFEFDDENIGLAEHWQLNHAYSLKINVPYCYQSQRSGIHDETMHPHVWYKKTFQYDGTHPGSVLLHFGAVDYKTRVWVNGQQVGEHFGGHTPFCFEISRELRPGKNEIVLWVEDTSSIEQPRGKQIWAVPAQRCWYIPTTGIWQTVWLEYVGDTYLDLVHITPDIDHAKAAVKIRWSGRRNPDSVVFRIWNGDRLIADEIHACTGNRLDFTVSISENDPVDPIHCWSPANPNLYDVEITLQRDGQTEDTVCTYFGMRKISTQNGLVLLNNRPCYQKMILDQGYWAESLLTPPESDSLRKDLEMIQTMGFNGVRKHQKIEDPRFYFWADVLGVLVWEEMPSCYGFSSEAMQRLSSEWFQVIRRDYNHPCVITWVPFNESWGVRNIFASQQQQDYVTMMYYQTKALDPCRLVNTNDGWEQINASDLCTIHDYRVSGDNLAEKYRGLDELLRRDAQGRMLYAQNNCWHGQPVLLSEFGGNAIGSTTTGWGYNENVDDAEALAMQYEGLIKAIRSVKEIQGYCYTQLTDIAPEMNGFLDGDHKPKVDLKRIGEINR